jgi:type II secretory pathway pseudopilin PulG
VKKHSGFAILEVMLATLLLVGLIVLVMHTMSGSRQQDAAREKGEMLSTALDDVLLTTETLTTGNLVENTTADNCNSSSGVLKDLADGYLNGLDTVGFNICTATIEVVAPS